MKQLYIFLLYFFALVFVCGKVEAQPTINIDPSFNIGTGFTGLNSSVQSIALQPDGKILVGGGFISYNGQPQYKIARLNADGSLDTSFETGTGVDNSFVAAITLQPDGKILIGGGFISYNEQLQYKIARLNTDGSLDISFNGGVNNYIVREITLQPDGKILVGGSFTQHNGQTQNRIVRLNADGSLDTSFNIGTGFNDEVLAITLQPDGKILVVGKFTSYNGQTRNSIVRLNTDGSIDTSFNIGTGFNIPEWTHNVSTIVLQPDGKILVGGSFVEYNGQSRNSIVRLNTDGSLDTSFNIGTGFYAAVTNGVIYTMALQPDGKILAGGEFISYNGQTQNRISRLNTDGSLDTSFETGTGFNSYVISIVLQPDGKILVGGNFGYYNGQSQMKIARLQELDCENTPPTPEATLIPIICSLIPEDIGTLVVTYPLGDEYEYSIDGVTYQSSPLFPNAWSFDTFQLTVKMGDCISEPLEFSNIGQSTVPEAEIIQPDCSDVPESGEFGTITVTFPLGDLFEFQYSIDGVNYQDSPVFYNVPPGSYELTFSMYDSENCVSDPLEVIIFALHIPDTPTATVVQPDCNNPYGSITVTSPWMDYPPYTYSINGEDYQFSPLFENLPSGTYQVTAKLFGAGCVSEPLEVNIHFAPEIPETPTVNVIQPTCENPYGSIEVTSPVDEGHEFIPNYEYSINGMDYYEFTVFDNLLSGDYYVTVRHLQSGCVSDPLEIILKGNLTCFIPKGISPNGDFKNDEFDLSDFGVVPFVQIFNRYGKEVYSQKDYTNQWKGQSDNGKELPTGTYYYVITFQNEEIKTGWVYLNR